MRFTQPRSSYTKGAIKIVPKDVNAEIYLSEYNGKLYAMGFKGKSNKPSFNGRFRTAEFREQYIKNWLESVRKSEAFKAEIRATRKAFVHSLKVGDILRTSWGYDQTNIDFYQVTELRGKCNVIIREIGQEQHQTTGLDSWTTMPALNSFRGEPMLKRVQEGNCIRIASYAMASLWSGKPQHASTGH